ERTARPVAPLKALRQLDAELALEDRLEAELEASGEPRGHLGVEHRGEVELEVALEEHDVVVGAVEDLLDLRIGHQRGQLREIGEDEGIDQRRAALGVADLEEADLLEVMEEAVRLGVECERTGSGDRADVFAQLPGRANEKGRRNDEGRG